MKHSTGSRRIASGVGGMPGASRKAPGTAIVAVALGLPSGAAAHAVLVSSTPVDGAVVTTSPASIELVFSERIAQVGASVRLLGPDGAPIALATPEVDQRRLTALVEGDVDEGTSTLAWSIISADGHRISGALAFAVSSTPGAAVPPDPTVAPVGPVAATAPEASPRGATTVASVVRAIRFAAILAIIGLVAILAFGWTRRPTDTEADLAFRSAARRLAIVATGTLAVVAVVYLPVEAWVAGISIGDVLTLRQGRVNVAMFLLALVSLPFLLRAARTGASRALVGAGVVAVGLAATPGLAGHPSGQDPVWVSATVDAVHVLAAGVWGGGILVLALTMPLALAASEDRRLLIGQVVRRFTRLALGAVVALVITGTVAAVIYVGSVQNLWDSTWGRVLLLKVALVLVAVLTAAVVRRRRDGFVRSVRFEALLIVAVIAVTGILTGLAPRTSAPLTDALRIEQRIDARTVVLEVVPVPGGESHRVALIATNDVGQPAIDVADGTVTLSSSDDEQVPVDLQRVEAAHWQGTVMLPAPGVWEATARLRIGTSRNETVSGSFAAN